MDVQEVNSYDLPAGSSLTVKSARKEPVKLTVTNKGAGSIIKVINGTDEKSIRSSESTSYTGNLRTQKTLITNDSKVAGKVYVVVENPTGKIQIKK